MNLAPETAIKDLENYLDNKNIQLTYESRLVFIEIEKICESVDNPPIYESILLACIRIILRFRKAMITFGGNPSIAEDVIYKKILDSRDELDSYGQETNPYTEIKYREVSTRPLLIDSVIKIAKNNLRKQISEFDVLEALFCLHDEAFPIWDNGSWSDESLHVPFNTLSHILGTYHSSLWVKMDDIKSYLGLEKEKFKEKLLNFAPNRLKDYLTYFLDDHPEYQKNCFLIMSFAETRFHKEIVSELRIILDEFGFNLLRADDRSYSDDLLANIETYMYGCGFGISIFERIQTDIYNPNVSFEVGYLTGLNKPVCYLKEKSLPKLPSDIGGKLYVDFDLGSLSSSLRKGIEKWLLDKRLIDRGREPLT